MQNQKTQFGISENPVPKIFKKPSSQPKTQFKFLPKLSFFANFSEKSQNLCKNFAILAKLRSKFPKTQFQKCKNSVFQKSEKRKKRAMRTKKNPEVSTKVQKGENQQNISLNPQCALPL